MAMQLNDNMKLYTLVHVTVLLEYINLVLISKYLTNVEINILNISYCVGIMLGTLATYYAGIIGGSLIVCI